MILRLRILITERLLRQYRYTLMNLDPNMESWAKLLLLGSSFPGTSPGSWFPPAPVWQLRCLKRSAGRWTPRTGPGSPSWKARPRRRRCGSFAVLCGFAVQARGGLGWVLRIREFGGVIGISTPKEKEDGRRKKQEIQLGHSCTAKYWDHQTKNDATEMI